MPLFQKGNTISKGQIPWNKGIKGYSISKPINRMPRTKEHNIKISKSNKGKKLSEKSKQKIREFNLGKKASPETKRKMSESHKKNPVRYFLGKHLSDEHKNNIRKSLEGRKFSEEWKRKIGDSRRGEKSHFWKGGISEIDYPLEWTDNLREIIRKRDEYICKICGLHQDELDGWQKQLDVHHIDYDKNNLNPDNLITLCRSCHQKTNFDRDNWIKYFKINHNRYDL